MNLFVALLTLGLNTTSSPVDWVIQADKSGSLVSPSLYGVFFEEINCAGDGGIYAELVRNRGFEDSAGLLHWKLTSGTAVIDRTEPLSLASPNALRLVKGKDVILENEGYWGLNVQANGLYDFSVFSKGDKGSLKVQLVSQQGEILSESNVALLNGAWNKKSTTVRARKSDSQAKLRLTISTEGETKIDMVSLFPKLTWKKRTNGLRTDLVQMLQDLKPAFVRFPGGCWVEGDTMDLALRWKRTIGNLEDRRTQPNIWRYMSTNGLGFHEYLQMCEDIGADALFVINCGMSHREVVPMDKMEEYVQDALDAIEYANGPVNSKWGAIRAKNGHPKPFSLKYLQIGNENGGPAYEERYGLMYRAIKQKYPKLNLIANLWGGRPQKTPVDILDEHYYSNPEFFINNADRYDAYDRKGPKIYVGEYAVTQGNGNGNGNLRGALAEAAFIAGMERNSDIVMMSSYAPLFANVNNKAWNPDLIYFDSHRAAGTPSYYVQKLFSNNRAHQIIPSQFANVPKVERHFPAGGFGVGTWNTHAEFKEMTVRQGNKVLFESKDGRGLTQESGSWESRDGVLSQTSNAAPSRAVVSATDWQDYTVELKAKKISGAEGFLILVGRRNTSDYLWWNLGGWGNTKHGVELASGGGKSILSQSDGRIETGRWYDIKLEYNRKRMRGYLDGRLIMDQKLVEPKSIHGVAGFDQSGKTVILKLVNVSNEAIDVNIDLKQTGWSKVAGTVQSLHGNNLDENTLDNPTRVLPKNSRIQPQFSQFKYRVSPRTLAVLRLAKA